MKKTILTLLAITLWTGLVQAQNNIVATVDSLTIIWDKEAIVLKTYEGMREYCHNGQHRRNTIKLVKTIHHYDSVLHKTVRDKYDANQDDEAKATLSDIEKLEKDYTTKEFLAFIHEECAEFNEIEKNYGSAKGKTYKKEVEKMEKQLVKYVEQITYQIDIIDEHIHHLKALEEVTLD